MMPPETCDDGSNNSVGCNPTCSGSLPGFQCTTGSPTLASLCNTVCEDGIRITPDEACDDGNSVANDGCTSCAVDVGYTCSSDNPSLCTPICGDGKVISPETCDDGSNN